MDELLREVQAEKEYIVDTLRALNEALQRKEKTVVELAAISTVLQNTYNGIENIRKRVLKFKGISITASESWRQNAHWDVYHASIQALRDSPGDGESSRGYIPIPPEDS